jgi:hypothetical protein
MRQGLHVWFVLISLFVVGCGSSVAPAPDSTPSTLVEITVEPVDQELLIDGTEPAISKYTATGRFADGHTEDISDKVGFSLANPELGGFIGRDFKSMLDRGGRTRVIAQLAGVQGETGLAIKIRQRYEDPSATGLPVDPEAPFTGPADAGRAPDVVYPNDGVLLPPNLRLLEVHFRPGTNNTLFEITFANDLTDIKVYTRCVTPLNGGCIYKPDATVWQWIAETNRGGDDVVVRTRGTDDAGTGVGTSTDIKLAFSYENVKGGIYYWKASSAQMNESAIMRFDFGNVAQQTAERFVGPDSAGGKCVGCHALSRDGTKMVASAGGWDVEDSLVVDVGTATRTATPGKAAFASWNPDGTEYVGVFSYTGTTTHNLMLFNGTTGVQSGTIDVGATSAQSTSHPDWSPDGSHIVYVRVGAASSDGVNNQRFHGGSIRMVSKQGAAWGTPTTIVAEQAGRNRYYPSFAPDGALLAFNESTCATPATPDITCNADSDPTATIYVVKPDPGATPVALTRANAPGKTDTGAALTNSWPKWAPFEFQRTQTPGSRVVWMTFSSSRNYGLRTPPAGTSAEATSGTLLWMVAIDPDRAIAGQDPSVAAFALPFQDLQSSNHIAQWTKEVIVLQ